MNQIDNIMKLVNDMADEKVIRAAIEQALGQGEPVAWQYLTNSNGWADLEDGEHARRYAEAGLTVRALYTAQPAAPQPQRDDTALLREENIKLRGWIKEEAQAAGRLQRQVHKDTALLRQALDAMEGCDDTRGLVKHDGQWMSRKSIAVAALKERLK
jgi:hypothetical protein